MREGCDDIGDARSRDELRSYRDRFARGAPSVAEDAMMRRWIPRRSRAPTRWDTMLAVLGGLVLMVVAVALIFGGFRM